MMSCELCGEIRYHALKDEDEGEHLYCFNCSPRYSRNHRVGNCELCGKAGVPIEIHHIYGRKHSAQVMVLCCSCHRIHHAKGDEKQHA